MSGGRLERASAWLRRPVDASSLALFRVLFGLVMAYAMVRMLTSGWIEQLYGEPDFYFRYWGMEWIAPLSTDAMYVLYGALAVLSLAIAVGAFTRISAALFAIGFAYAELIDVTNYLNHYYLVTLLAVLMVFVPTERTWSVDAWRKPARASATVPAWALYLLRAQIALVYFYAGLAKLQSDWLLHAQPLNIWLTARLDTPIIGPMLDETWLHYAASWAAFLFDTTIVVWLSIRRTRPWAYLVLCGFHFFTGVFFNIGMFPVIMTTAATLFFAPSWPRDLGRRMGRWNGAFGRRLAAGAPGPAQLAPAPQSLRRLGFAVAGLYLAFQVLLPLRHYLYPGDVLWNEQGMRFAWKVMVREKHGSVTYHVRMKDSGKSLQVSPRRYLTARQEREMAGQPDLVAQLARHIARDFERRGYGEVEVRAEALVSLNGRRAQAMIDPTVDLAGQPDDLAPAPWITEGPASDPIRLHKAARVARRSP